MHRDRRVWIDLRLKKDGRQIVVAGVAGCAAAASTQINKEQRASTYDKIEQRQYTLVLNI